MRDQCWLQYRMTTATLLREQLDSFQSSSLDKMVTKNYTKVFLLATFFIFTSHIIFPWSFGYIDAPLMSYCQGLIMIAVFNI